MAAQKLRILQVLRAPIGGLYRHVADLSAELSNRGHELGLVIARDLEDAQTEVRLEALKPHLKLGVHRLPMARLLGVSDVTTPLALRRLAGELNIDIIHGHGAKGGFHARLARWGKATPKAIYTPHGGALHFSPKSLQGRLFDTIERGLFSLTGGVAFESAYARTLYLKRIGVPPCPHPVIHNGLADDEFSQVPVRNDAADFGFVGELRELKGITYLLDALVDLRAPDGRPASLVMAGGGAMRAEIEARIAEPDLAGRVTLLGVQPARDVFARCRYMVVPSLAESLPYVVLEAIAAGRPVIATSVGGIPEIFGEHADQLIASADAPALHNAMQAFLDDDAAAQAAAKSRRAFVKKAFSITSMTDGVEALYGQAKPSN